MSPRGAGPRVPVSQCVWESACADGARQEPRLPLWAWVHRLACRRHVHLTCGAHADRVFETLGLSAWPKSPRLMQLSVLMLVLAVWGRARESQVIKPRSSVLVPWGSLSGS